MKKKLLIGVLLFLYSFNYAELGKIGKLTETEWNTIIAGSLAAVGLFSSLDFIKPEIGDSLLHKAVKTNDTQQAKLLLNKGFNINVANTWNGETPLHTAVKNNNLAMVKFLLEAGADPNIKNKKMNPFPLFDSPKDITETPLHYAVKKDYLEIAKVLLNNGAAIDMQNERGNTALHLAVLENNSEMVNFLLSSGANQYIRNRPGFMAIYVNTPLDLAYSSSSINPEIIKSLKKDSWFSWLW